MRQGGPPAVFPRYSDVENVYGRLWRRVLEDFPRLTLYMDECVRFSYNFYDEMSCYIDRNVDADKDGNLAKRASIVHGLYPKNNSYLRSAYQLVLDGHASSTSHILRAVYEAVLVQYWVSLCKEEDVIEYEDNLTLGKKTPKFEDLRKKLYEGEIFESAGRAYTKLSAYAHPNPIPLDLKYCRRQMRGVIEVMLTLSLYNTLSYSQLYSHFEESVLRAVRGKTEWFVKEMLQANYKLYMLFPNHPEFANQLVWYPSQLD